MSNDFFSDHPMLGSMFDFNRDGSMSLGEAGAMGAFGSLYATEVMRASEEAEREVRGSSWDDDDYGLHSGKKRKKNAKRDSDYGYDDDYVEYDEDRVYDIDTSNADDVMLAVASGDFDEADIEYLVHEALCSGVEFDRGDTEELLDNINDRSIRDWLESSLD